MKHYLLFLSLIFPAILSAGAIASTDEAFLDGIKTRLFQMQNLTATYEKTEWYNPLDISIKHAEEATARNGNLVLPYSGIWRKKEAFSFLNGKRKSESLTIDHERTILPQGRHIRETDYVVYVITEDRGERLIHYEDAEHYIGTISPLDKLEIQRGDLGRQLGLVKDDSSYLDPESLGSLEVVGSHDNQIILRKTGDDVIFEWSFDKKMDYALTSYKIIAPSDQRVCQEVQMEEFKEISGVFLPMKITARHRDPREGEPDTVFEEITYYIEAYQLNDPANTHESYKIQWPENTIVYDRRTGISFRYINGRMDLKDQTIYDVDLRDVDQILAKVSNRSPSDPNTEIFVPRISAALERQKPYLFDLATSQLIQFEGDITDPNTRSKSEQLQQGNLAWDDKIVTIRQTRLLSTTGSDKQSLKQQKQNELDVYVLADDINFPYRMIACTEEGHYYLVTLRRVDKNGILIKNRKLDPHEMDDLLFKPTAAKE